MDPFDCFDRVVIINLPERKDHRRRWSASYSSRAYRRSGSSSFTYPSAGPRRLAYFGGARQFSQPLNSASPGRATAAPDRSPSWEMIAISSHASLAYRGNWLNLSPGLIGVSCSLGTANPAPREHPPDCAPARFTGSCCARWSIFLESVLSRFAGHPLGEPELYHGALQTFREQNPGIPRCSRGPTSATKGVAAA